MPADQRLPGDLVAQGFRLIGSAAQVSANINPWRAVRLGAACHYRRLTLRAAGMTQVTVTNLELTSSQE